MIQQIEVAKMIGVAHIDNLLQEMLLGGETVDQQPISYSPPQNQSVACDSQCDSQSQIISGVDQPMDTMDPMLPVATDPSIPESVEDPMLFKNKDDNQNFISDQNMEMFSGRAPPQYQELVRGNANLNMTLNQYNNQNLNRKVAGSYKNQFQGLYPIQDSSEMLVLKEEPENNGY
jgi:nuclear factor 4